jgi:hypothetical protein
MPYSEADITTDQPDSEVDITTDQPDVSTAKTPKARSTRRQGRSFMSPEGDVILEARMGTIPCTVRGSALCSLSTSHVSCSWI